MAEINFYNQDCISFMKTKPDNYYDLAIVDPPYGIDIAKWDTMEHKPKPEYFEQLFRVSKNQIIWGGNYFNLPHSEAWICWDKTFKFNRNIDIGEFEMAWTSFEHKAKFLRFTYCGNFYGWEKPKANYKKPKNIHITQKPIDIYRWLLKEYAENGFNILDTHGGSHTNAIACDMEGFDLDICEIDTEYFNNGIKKYNEFKQQTTLFSPI